MPAHQRSVLARLQDAMNQHDLDALIACFAPDFRSEQPNHPQRAFRGTDQVRKNWSAIFGTMPDFHADVLTSCRQGGTVWSEWRWVGTVRGNVRRELRGVIVLGVDDDRIVWGRLYMERSETDGEDIDASVQRMTQPSRGVEPRLG